MSEVHHSRFRARRRGQSLVELALMLPLITLILVGALDLGRVFYSYTRLTSATREGALFGSYISWNASLTPGTADITARTYSEAQGQLGTTGTGNDFEATVTCYTPDMAATKACGPITTAGTARSGDIIEVRGTYRFRPLTFYISGLMGNPITIRKTTRMVIQ